MVKAIDQVMDGIYHLVLGLSQVVTLGEALVKAKYQHEIGANSKRSCSLLPSPVRLRYTVQADAYIIATDIRHGKTKTLQSLKRKQPLFAYLRHLLIFVDLASLGSSFG